MSFPSSPTPSHNLLLLDLSGMKEGYENADGSKVVVVLDVPYLES